jgi:hypothetical protein
LQGLELPPPARGLVVVRRPDRKPSRVDRLDLWLSKGRTIDGLWVGTTESEPHPALHRVEDALRLIKHHDPLSYSRVTSNLDRIWVNLIPYALAHYSRSLNACVLDERFVLQETTTLERLASAIVHETTHARLDGWGIDYEEKMRARIEAICIRRELNFLKRFPSTALLQEEKTYKLEWYATNQEYLSDTNFRVRDDQGHAELLRHLGAPGWFVRFAMWLLRRRRLRTFAREDRNIGKATSPPEL